MVLGEMVELLVHELVDLVEELLDMDMFRTLPLHNMQVLLEIHQQIPIIHKFKDILVEQMVLVLEITMLVAVVVVPVVPVILVTAGELVVEIPLHQVMADLEYK